MYNILIVEDDTDIRHGLTLALQCDLYDIRTASSISEAKQIFITEAIDLIILDINLPDGNGLEFCQMVREISDILIIFLTINNFESDELKAFKLGAVDYITKPFSISVLRERVANALKHKNNSDMIYSNKNFKFNFNTHEYNIDGNEIILSLTDEKLLHYFIKNRNNIITREELTKFLWNNSEYLDGNTLTVFIKRLRKKLNCDNIKTIYGIGYKWED